MPESFPKTDLGFVYVQNGLDYFSMIPSGKAVDFWHFIENHGCMIKEIHSIKTAWDLDYFLSREKEYREKIWIKSGKGKDHFFH